MGFFKEKGGDVIDFTRLQKRGILQRAMESSANNQNDGEVIDLGAANQTNTGAGESTGNAFSNLFGALDNPSSSTNSLTDTASNSNSLGASETAFNDMKVKLENTEYKLERALERLAQIEEKLANFKITS